jgi:hypothetical protein
MSKYFTYLNSSRSITHAQCVRCNFLQDKLWKTHNYKSGKHMNHVIKLFVIIYLRKRFQPSNFREISKLENTWV